MHVCGEPFTVLKPIFPPLIYLNTLIKMLLILVPK